jgi:hypothetical protein
VTTFIERSYSFINDKRKYDKGNLLILGLVLIVLVLIFSYGTGQASAASNAAIYVNNTLGSDTWDGQYATFQTGTLHGPKYSIKNATGTVDTNGTIYIANGQYKGIDNTNITINRNMSIAGQSETGTIINGTGISWIFHINSGITFKILNLTLTNGNNNYGGAIYNFGSIYVTNTTLTSNKATYWGGAIENAASSNCNLNGCTFTNNLASTGGAIDTNSNCILIVTNSMFTLNNGTSGAGAICSDWIMNLTDSTFIGNFGYTGGAIICGYNSNIIGNNFINNTATLYGSVICNSGTANVKFNRIIENTDSMGYTIFCNTFGTVDASLNWWGSNSDPSSNVYGLVGVTPWLVLTTQSNPNTIPSNGNSIVIADLLHDSNGTFNDPVYGHVPDGIDVIFTTTLGSISSPLSTINGLVQSTFKGGIYAGIATVTATIGNFSVKTYVNILDTISPTANANPTSGVYTSIQNVTLSMTEAGTIYYTTNGTTPTFNSNRYLSPIQITKTTTLKYFAMDLTGNISPIYTNTYTINTIPLTASSNTTNGLYNSTQNVALSMNYPGTIYYTTDGNTPTFNSNRYISPISISKTTILKFFAMDLAGNSSPIYTNTYNIDMVLPTVNASILGGFYNTTKNVNLTMSEPGTIYYTLNGTTPTISSNKYTSPLTISSTTILKYLAVDLAGNKSPIYSQNYTIDKTAPKVSSTTPKSGATGISKTAIITIKFNENIKNSTYFNTITIKNLTTGKYISLTKAINGNTLTIKTSTKTANTWYLVTIPKGAIKDYAGNNLAANYTFKFKTGA